MNPVIETVTTDEGMYQLEVTQQNPFPLIKKFFISIFWTYSVRHFYVVWIAARYCKWNIEEAFKRFPAE